MRILSGTYNLLMGVAFGTLLAGSGVLAYYRGQGNRSYPSLPGHWLLLFGMAAALADGVAVVVFRSLAAAWFSPGDYITVYWLAYRMARNPNLPGMFHQCVGWGLGSVLALAFFWGLKRRLSWPWRAVFLAFFLTAGVLAAGAIVSTISAYGPSGWSGPLLWYRQAIHLYAGFVVLCTALILLAVLRDRFSGILADGLHWTGVAAWLTIAVAQGTLYAIAML
jgi:hypothetical protein